MNFLTDAELILLYNEVNNNIDYTSTIRKVFLREINKKFKDRLMEDSNPSLQLELDLMELNRDVPLTDGSIPFLGWLMQASRYLQHIDAANKIIQHAIRVIDTKTPGARPLINPTAPSQGIIQNIVKERVIHQNDMLSYAFLEAGWKAGISVARLLVPRFEGGSRKQDITGSGIVSAGTGWLLSRQLLITNHHVIDAREANEPNALPQDFTLQAMHISIQFDYNIDGAQGFVLKVSALEIADADLDFAILRLEAPVDRLPPARFPQPIHVIRSNPQAINIIQHPFGYAKKVAIRNNHIFDSTYPRIRYFTDTEKGSSGSPVFNDSWQVIALHHASELVDGVQYQGKSTGWVNEGIQLKAIFDHLAEKAPALSAELLNS